MPWQTVMKLQGQTHLRCGVSLNCMWSLGLESKGREQASHMQVGPHHVCTPSFRD